MNDWIETNLSRTPMVRERDGEVFANSRDVALFFNKHVKDIHRDIRNLIEKAPELGRRNFAPNESKDLTGFYVESYDMDRDGFMLLAMGFTGEKALRLKMRFLEAFKAMEAEIARLRRAPVQIDLNDPNALRGLLLTYTERAAQAEARVAVLEPESRAYQRIAASDGSYNGTEAAKMLQVPPQRLFKWMREHRWTYKRPGAAYWLGYQDKIEAGFIVHKSTTITTDDGDRTHVQLRITPKGLARLAKVMPGAVPVRVDEMA